MRCGITCLILRWHPWSLLISAKGTGTLQAPLTCMDAGRKGAASLVQTTWVHSEMRVGRPSFVLSVVRMLRC